MKTNIIVILLTFASAWISFNATSATTNVSNTQFNVTEEEDPTLVEPEPGYLCVICPRCCKEKDSEEDEET